MAWRTEFQLKDLLTGEDVKPKRAHFLALQVASRLEAYGPFRTQNLRRLSASFRAVSDQDSFNNALDDLYNVADRERVWIE